MLVVRGGMAEGGLAQEESVMNEQRSSPQGGLFRSKMCQDGMMRLKQSRGRN